MHKFKETQPRSIAKVISWRVLLTCSHIVNALVVTGSLILGLKIAGFAAILNSFLFWSHERLWNFAQWNRTGNETQVFVEGQPRTVGKIVTWRILITLSNFLIPYIMTGSLGTATLFAGMATVINMVLFWAHERVWNHAKWGKIDSAAE